MLTANKYWGKETEKLTKYRQLAFEVREGRPGYEIYVVPVVVDALDGDIKALKVNLKKIFNNNELLEEVVPVMQTTVLMDSESIVESEELCLVLSKENIMNSLF